MSDAHLPIELLSAYLDGETTPGERDRVEGHLASCAACRSELEDLRRIVDASARLEAIEVPAGLRARIGAAVAPARPRRGAWIGAAASLAAVGLVATVWLLQGPPPPPPRIPAPVAAPPEEPESDALDRVGKSVAPAAPAAPPPEPRRSAPPPAAKQERPLVREEAERPQPEATPPLETASEYVLDRSRDAAPPSKMTAAGSAAPGSRDADPCGAASPLEVTLDLPLDRESLESALRREGGRPLATSRPGVLEAMVPGDRWPACREALAEAGIVVDDAKLDTKGGRCVALTIRYPAP